jgi:SET domain-containing protein
MDIDIPNPLKKGVVIYYDAGIDEIPFIEFSPLIINNINYGIKRFIIDDISNIKPLLLTINNNELEYIKGSGGIITKVPIIKDQIITYYEGTVKKDDDNDIIKTRSFIDDYNIIINYDKNMVKRGMGAGGFVRDIYNAFPLIEKIEEKKQKVVKKSVLEPNVRISFIDTYFNFLNLPEFNFIDSRTIDDIRNKKPIESGLRLEDRIVVLKALDDIPVNTELLLESNSTSFWNYTYKQYQKNMINMYRNLEPFLGTRRILLEIDKLKIDNVTLENKLMLLTDLSNIKDLFFTFGRELEYRESTLVEKYPEAGNGVYTKVKIKKNQIITIYDGRVVPNITDDDKLYIKHHKTYTMELLENEYVVIGDQYNKNKEEKIDLTNPDNLNNMGAGAFLNDGTKDKINNIRFLPIYNDCFYLNELEEQQNNPRIYIDNKFIYDILNNIDQPKTKLRPFDGVLLLTAKRDIAIGEELFGAYGKEYWGKAKRSK